MKNKLNYSPTLEELGISEQDYNFFMQNAYGQGLYDQQVNAWIVRNNERIQRLILRREKSKITKGKTLDDHWFNTLKHPEISELINKTRANVDQVIDSILKTQTKQCFIDYFERMRFNVKKSDMKITYADHKKLSRFPKHNKYNSELFGSNARMIALWAHVFSLRD